jgi:hypothetical protein
MGSSHCPEAHSLRGWPVGVGALTFLRMTCIAFIIGRINPNRPGTVICWRDCPLIKELSLDPRPRSRS